MKQIFYSHIDKLEGAQVEFTKRGFVTVSEAQDSQDIHPLAFALFTMRLALRLGIKLPALEETHRI